MICPSCGKEIEEGLHFCPQCGEKIDPIEAIIKEADAPTRQPAPAEEPAPAAPAPHKESGNAKRIGIAVAVIVLVIAALFAGRAVLTKMHEKAYAEAKKELAAGNYEEAKKQFEDLDGFKDSEDQIKFCEKCIDYEAAEKLFEDGSYEEAQAAYEKLGDFKESETQIERCKNIMQYQEAEKLFKDKEYKKAQEAYGKLPDITNGDYPKAQEHLTYCRNIISYNNASKLLKQKKYYQAYIAFNTLGDFKDARKKASSCKQTFPATGETYRNPAYASQSVALKIVPPSNGTYNYIKIYSGKTLVSCVAIGKNSQTTVSLPVGSYKLKNAYSSGDWYGADDMFGDSGTYIKLTNGSTDNFKLEANMQYTLTLRSSTATGGNSVGSQSENRSSF